MLRLTERSLVSVAAGLIMALVVAGGILPPSPVVAQGVAPQHEYDHTWPRLPLPDRWIIGEVGGICVDHDDNVFLLNRPGTLREHDLDAGIEAPPVIQLDPEGHVINSWGDPDVLGALLHDCTVDPDGDIWVIGARASFIQKYSIDGELLMQIGEPGDYDTSDGTSQGQPLNSDVARFVQPAGIAVDPTNGDIYLSDGEATGGNHRVVVMDSDGRFLRQWMLHRTDDEADIAQILHCLRLSNDGLVYVCDRRAFRIQVFDKLGNFQRNIDVPWTQHTPWDGQRRTGVYGSAAALDFSPDREQRYLYVVNEDNEQIEILDRRTGEVLSTFGHGPGHFPGQTIHAHGIAVDSRGNVYVAEVNEGKRAQRFKIVP